jgi:hypothetical protein
MVHDNNIDFSLQHMKQRQYPPEIQATRILLLIRFHGIDGS